ncbi:MAG TPA: mitochondrial fission ELM1 family protein [Chiayiivirga sp.]|nr:mitochondrial fission ELM1 family protein [Chiayiivirga sp.]
MSDAPRVLAISDGHAGNARQAEALATALSDSVETLCLQACAPWRWAAPHRLPGATRAFGPEFKQRLQTPFPDLVIGCGRQAALATRLLREASAGRCRAVQILDPRIAPSHYDWVVAPRHDGLQGGNVITTLGALNAVDDAALERARLQFPDFGHLPSPRYAVLLGGPTSAVKLDQTYWTALVAQLKPRLVAEGASLMLTSSRRTPDWLRAAAHTSLSDIPGLQWHGPDARGANPYAGFLAWADVIVVTPDSVNLLSEAAATRVPVWTFAPEPLGGKVGRFVQALCDSGRVARLGMDAAPATIVPLRETVNVAAQIRTRWHGSRPA